MSLVDTLEAGLEEVRDRTLAHLEPLSDAALTTQHSPLMSPLAWDLGHVANYEEQWLLRPLGGRACRPDLDGLYDAFKHPRRTRESLPILDPPAARAYAASVRGRVLDLLESLDFEAPLTRDGFVHRMVIQHEHQHDETILAAIALLPSPGYRPSLRATTAAPYAGPAEVLLPGGSFVMGTSSDPWALDNEKPAHPVTVEPFWLDATPVTNAAYAEFIAAGGYESSQWWTPAGWAWRLEAGLEAPQFWREDGGIDRFGLAVERVPDEPVQHVCWYEADAFARWAGKRLPTEQEWEFAASNGGTTRWPWGATFDDDAAHLWPNATYGPSSPGPAGADQWGVLGLIGDVWEWTSSDFVGHPGFESWPYREYSEVFFGPEYKVLRGGSWATHASPIRATFRNWDYPIRRQIFAGFRCARDAA